MSSYLKITNSYRGDIIDLASNNGILRSDAVIRDVASLKSLRTIALKNGVAEEWIGRVESTIVEHLRAWGEWEEDGKRAPVIINGHEIKDIRLEETYKGNYHLYAVIDGCERKFVISKNKEEFSLIKKAGVSNITDEQLDIMVCKYFKL